MNLRFDEHYLASVDNASEASLKRRDDLIAERFPIIFSKLNYPGEPAEVKKAIIDCVENHDLISNNYMSDEQIDKRLNLLFQEKTKRNKDTATVTMAINSKYKKGKSVTWATKIRDIIFRVHFTHYAGKDAENAPISEELFCKLYNQVLDAIRLFEQVEDHQTQEEEEDVSDPANDTKLKIDICNQPQLYTEVAHGSRIGVVGGDSFNLTAKSQRQGNHDLPIDLNLSLQTRHKVDGFDFDLICNYFMVAIYYEDGDRYAIEDLRALREENPDTVIYPDGVSSDTPWWTIQLKNDDRRLRISDEALCEFLDNTGLAVDSTYRAEVYLNTEEDIRVDPNWGTSDENENGIRSATRERFIELLVRKGAEEIPEHKLRPKNFPVIAQQRLKITRD